MEKKTNDEWVINYGFVCHDNPVRAISIPLPSLSELPLSSHHKKQKYYIERECALNIDNRPGSGQGWKTLRILWCANKERLENSSRSFSERGSYDLERTVCLYVLDILTSWSEFPLSSWQRGRNTDSSDERGILLARFLEEHQLVVKELVVVYRRYLSQLAGE